MTSELRPAGKTILSCGHEDVDGCLGVSVQFDDEDCVAGEGFIPVTVYAQYCHDCAKTLYYELGKDTGRVETGLVRAEQAAELAKWRDKYNELGQMALEQVSDLGTKLGRLDVELDAAKADLQAANRELAKFKALAETLAGALEPVERLEMWSSSAKDSDMVVTSMATVRKMREALREYKEATNV